MGVICTFLISDFWEGYGLFQKSMMAAKNIQISKIRKYLPKLDPGILDTSKLYVSAEKLFENLRTFVENHFFSE